MTVHLPANCRPRLAGHGRAAVCWTLSLKRATLLPPAEHLLPKRRSRWRTRKRSTAESDRDFAEIIYFLETRVLRSDAMTPAHRTYAERLKGWAHNRLGEALVERGRDTAALGEFDVAVQLNPNHWEKLDITVASAMPSTTSWTRPWRICTM